MRAVALDGDSADAHVALAVAALVPTGRLTEASAEFARALELDPQSYLANVGAAFAFLAQGPIPKRLPNTSGPPISIRPTPTRSGTSAWLTRSPAARKKP
jgi:tetratricopeptide (TPR) repeat protein